MRIFWFIAAVILIGLGLSAQAQTSSAKPFEQDPLCFNEKLCKVVCDLPACQRRVPRELWSGVLATGGLVLRLTEARLLLPENPEWFQIGRDSSVWVRYPGRKTITFDRMRAKVFGIQEYFGSDSGIKFSDIPRIQFEEGFEAAEPLDLSSLRVWRHAMLFKKDGFRRAQRLFSTRRAGLSVYVEGELDGELNHVAWLVNESELNGYTMIQAKGFSFDEFLAVLMTAKEGSD